MTTCNGGGVGRFGLFPSPEEFSFNATITVANISTTSPLLEFSGGDFLSSTCSHFVVSDSRSFKEYHIDISSESSDAILQEISSYRLRGFSGDYEGICFYKEDDKSPMKLAILDERNRTAALCNFPPLSNTIDLENEDECVSFSLLATSDSNLTSLAPNQGFEGVACDPEDKKLYIAQEKNPMAIWQLDLVTGTFETLIPVSSLADWTDLVSDLAGITFDPIKRTLYVLSQESKLVVESTLQGDILGLPLNVSQANQPEGIYFASTATNNTRPELWIASEPNELLLFKTDTDFHNDTGSPTSSPSATHDVGVSGSGDPTMEPTNSLISPFIPQPSISPTTTTMGPTAPGSTSFPTTFPFIGTGMPSGTSKGPCGTLFVVFFFLLALLLAG